LSFSCFRKFVRVKLKKIKAELLIFSAQLANAPIEIRIQLKIDEKGKLFAGTLFFLIHIINQ